MTTTTTVKPISEKQAAFIRSLKAELGMTVDEDGLASLTSKMASTMISALLERRDERRAQKLAEDSEVAGEPLVAVLPEGYFTVVLEDGSHRTFRAKDASDRSRLAGRRILSYLSGSNNESDYTGFGFVTEKGIQIWRRFSEDSVLADAARVLVGDPSAAQKAYAVTSGNCYVCGKMLTEPLSIELGIGPVCRAAQ